jgi:hypothetical protein
MHRVKSLEDSLGVLTADCLSTGTSLSREIVVDETAIRIGG